MHAGVQTALQFAEENTERVNREKDAPVTVIIGNPPYNAGQVNENDNNKNRKYPTVDKRIRETYGKDSNATLTSRIYDPYVRFFRWAIDRLEGRDGIVAYVTNNSYLDQIAFDGMRHHLLRDFDAIYHLDMHGNVRKNPKLSGTTHNVFGIQVGVSITLLVRNQSVDKGIFYHRLPETWTRGEKTTYLKTTKSLTSVPWQTLIPDAKNNWITEGMQADFADFLPMGTKEAKAGDTLDAKTIFRQYSNGTNSGRDSVVYDYNKMTLAKRMAEFVKEYNSEVVRWVKNGSPADIDNFVDYSLIKWSRNLKSELKRKRKLAFQPSDIVSTLYRPYTTKHMATAEYVIDEPGTLMEFFPKKNRDNIGICLSIVGSSKAFHTITTAKLPDYHSVGDTKCFPLYTYALDGKIRKDNITDWAVAQFRTHHADPTLTKPDIFAYVYAVLHHPEYRTRYAENLKRELPRIPLVGTLETFAALRDAGNALAALHIGYETVAEYDLKEIVTDSEHRPFTWRVEKMKRTGDGAGIVVNKTLTLTGIPPQAWEYRLGNRSALDWIVDQYQVTTDKRSQITSDPNRDDDPQYIVRLVKRIVTVSLNTQTILSTLPSLNLSDN